MIGADCYFLPVVPFRFALYKVVSGSYGALKTLNVLEFYFQNSRS